MFSIVVARATPAPAGRFATTTAPFQKRYISWATSQQPSPAAYAAAAAAATRTNNTPSAAGSRSTTASYQTNSTRSTPLRHIEHDFEQSREQEMRGSEGDYKKVIKELGQIVEDAAGVIY
ncbi:hypothetical protein TruAng_011280 [Truncatella angustata]|nr:hypothetical protein TruAng_011280 [Truncatella angustata]